jgi:hypothetical protein
VPDRAPNPTLRRWRPSISVEDDALRLEFGTADWFGPGRFTVARPSQHLAVTDQHDNSIVVADDGAVRMSVRARTASRLVVFPMEALAAISGFATGSSRDPRTRGRHSTRAAARPEAPPNRWCGGSREVTFCPTE